jgi:SAM-dependent methyltransferase
MCLPAALWVVKQHQSDAQHWCPCNDGSPQAAAPALSQLPMIADSTSRFVQGIPFGRLGPEGTGGGRHRYRYYDLLLSLSIEFGHGAKNALEVGCAADPFLKHLAWIPTRTCLAPYYAYGKTTAHAVNMTMGDFMEWNWTPEQQRFDLVLCSQVVEHVTDPRAFVQKLLEVSKTLIVSVPYRWSRDSTSAKAHHVSHDIDEQTVATWAKPHVAVATARITDLGKERLIAVFVREDR